MKNAREKQGLTAREAADQLHFMPDYVDILERGDYESLRSPQFARAYVKAYGRLLGLDEPHLLSLFDACNTQLTKREKPRIETRPLQLQRTGLGVVIGLGVLLLLVVGLWWWGQGRNETTATREGAVRLPGGAMTRIGALQ
ncbi:MAG: helix-turn-helix domain-containing protein [Halioglobus sp.]|nr:helix-turn-helix domain-containing protein [Halioglobus sp.]